MFTIATINRIIVASALATGVLSAGVAASAQTTAAPATTAATSATNVGMMTSQPSRKAQLEAENADERRIAFRHQGTSL